jgi:Family of unknown function (DUF6789)
MDDRIRRGLLAGLLATLAMTVVMLAGSATGFSPIPRPIPIALLAWAVRGALPRPALLAGGMLAHFAYGGLAGALFAWTLRRYANVWSGLAFGVLLWLGMGLLWLPLLHWGRFGALVHPGIGAATLLLHLVYGGVLGWLCARWRPAAPAVQAP